MTYLRSHDRDNDKKAAERLRRQFESGATARFAFPNAPIPDYAIFRRKWLSAELRTKLAYRRTLGYTDPRALTAKQLSERCEEARESNLYLVSNWKDEIKYGGPIAPPPSRIATFFYCLLTG